MILAACCVLVLVVTYKKGYLPYMHMRHYQKQGVIFPPTYIPFLGHWYGLHKSWKKNGGLYGQEYFMRLLETVEEPKVCGYLHGSVLILMGCDPTHYSEIV